MYMHVRLSECTHAYSMNAHRTHTWHTRHARTAHMHVCAQVCIVRLYALFGCMHCSAVCIVRHTGSDAPQLYLLHPPLQVRTSVSATRACLLVLGLVRVHAHPRTKRTNRRRLTARPPTSAWPQTPSDRRRACVCGCGRAVVHVMPRSVGLGLPLQPPIHCCRQLELLADGGVGSQ